MLNRESSPKRAIEHLASLRTAILRGFTERHVGSVKNTLKLELKPHQDYQWGIRAVLVTCALAGSELRPEGLCRRQKGYTPRFLVGFIRILEIPALCQYNTCLSHSLLLYNTDPAECLTHADRPGLRTDMTERFSLLPRFTSGVSRASF